MDVTGVGQAVPAADLWPAALGLVPSEARLAAAAVVGALRRQQEPSAPQQGRIQEEGSEERFLEKWQHTTEL